MTNIQPFFMKSINCNAPMDDSLVFQRNNQGVQEISKNVINGSILVIKYAVEGLDKNKHF